MKIPPDLERKILEQAGVAVDCREVSFALPLPPSTNNLYVNVPGKGRAKSAAYRKWLKAAGGVLASFSGVHVPSPVAVHILVHGKCDRRDGDNFFKATLDAVKAAGLIEDDSLKHVRSLGLDLWHAAAVEPYLEVTVRHIREVLA